MYIRSLHVDHLKRLRNFELDFTEGGEPRMWTVLIGENGTAKTTILQAIALAATGSSQVNTLAGPIVKHMRDKRDNKPMSIDARFDFTLSSKGAAIHPLLPRAAQRTTLQSSLTLKPGQSTTLRATAHYAELDKDAIIQTEDDPLDDARDVHRPLWFVAGYGISRLLPDPEKTPSLARPSIERMRPLFDTTTMLASTSFSNHFLKKDLEEGRPRGTTSRMFSKMLNQAIKLGGEDLLPGIKKLELRGQGGTQSAPDLIESDRFHQRMGKKMERVSGVALSHGYQSTFAWIADLIGHVLLESKTALETTEMEGLVLIDEIDAYLHPVWQATLVTGLRRVFPKMQFVASTHSPVVLAGLEPNEIVRLVMNEETGNVEEKKWSSPSGDESGTPPDPRPMTGSEIYRIWFDLDRLTPNPHGEQLRRYLILAGDPFRTDEEEKERKALLRVLAEAMIDPGRKPVRREKSK